MKCDSPFQLEEVCSPGHPDASFPSLLQIFQGISPSKGFCYFSSHYNKSLLSRQKNNDRNSSNPHYFSSSFFQYNTSAIWKVGAFEKKKEKKKIFCSPPKKRYYYINILLSTRVFSFVTATSISFYFIFSFLRSDKEIDSYNYKSSVAQSCPSTVPQLKSTTQNRQRSPSPTACVSVCA